MTSSNIALVETQSRLSVRFALENLRLISQDDPEWFSSVGLPAHIEYRFASKRRKLAVGKDVNHGYVDIFHVADTWRIGRMKSPLISKKLLFFPVSSGSEPWAKLLVA